MSVRLVLALTGSACILSAQGVWTPIMFWQVDSYGTAEIWNRAD
jgi:hypothetical protein